VQLGIETLVLEGHQREAAGPGLVPFRYSKTVHGGFGGGAIAVIKNGQIVVTGKPMVTDPGSGPITVSNMTPAQVGDNGIIKP
jgi:hypothetical protein